MSLQKENNIEFDGSVHGYTSIFFSPEWIMGRYRGWKEVFRDKGCVVLKRGQLLKRTCIITVESFDAFFSRSDATKLLDGSGPLTLKFASPTEFTNEPDAIDWVNFKYNLLKVSDEFRIFHKFTLIVDLRRSEEQLWLTMRSTNRNLCRRAQLATEYKFLSIPDKGMLDRFFEAYIPMAKNRKLAIPNRTTIEKMIKDGYLALAYVAGVRRGAAIALIYIAGDSAMYLYGVSERNISEGAGQLLQWEIIRTLKSFGIAWYDFGGVPCFDKCDGIFKFKSGFGGSELTLGSEFVRHPGWYKKILQIKKVLV